MQILPTFILVSTNDEVIAMNLLRHIFLYIPATVTAIIVVVEISLVADFDVLQSDVFLYDSRGRKCVHERDSFEVGYREVVFPQVHAPVNLRP
jgi:hypothetical protein